MGKKKADAKAQRAIQRGNETLSHWNESFQIAFESLKASSAEDRVKGLKEVTRALREDEFPVSTIELTLTDVGVAGMTSANEDERKLACDLLCFMALECGRSHRSLFDGVMPVLEDLFVKLQMEESSCAAAEHLLRVAGVFSYMVFSKEEVLVLCDLILPLLSDETADPTLLVAASTALSLMAFAVGGEELSISLIPDNLRTIFETLQRCESADVQISLGSLIACLVSAYREYVQADGEQEGDEEEMSSCADLAGFVDHQDMLSEFESLANCSSKHHSKSDKAKLRKHFKSILLSLTELEEPSEELEVNHQFVDIDGWHEVVVLEMIRETLAEYTLNHLAGRERLQQLLNVELDKNYVHRTLSQVEKRVYRGENRKKQKRTRGQEREDKAAGGSGVASFTSAGDE